VVSAPPLHLIQLIALSETRREEMLMAGVQRRSWRRSMFLDCSSVGMFLDCSRVAENAP
jgi:hypothetical protein